MNMSIDGLSRKTFGIQTQHFDPSTFKQPSLISRQLASKRCFLFLKSRLGSTTTLISRGLLHSSPIFRFTHGSMLSRAYDSHCLHARARILESNATTPSFTSTLDRLCFRHIIVLGHRSVADVATCPSPDWLSWGGLLYDHTVLQSSFTSSDR